MASTDSSNSFKNACGLLGALGGFVFAAGGHAEPGQALAGAVVGGLVGLAVGHAVTLALRVLFALLVIGITVLRVLLLIGRIGNMAATAAPPPRPVDVPVRETAPWSPPPTAPAVAPAAPVLPVAPAPLVSAVCVSNPGAPNPHSVAFEMSWGGSRDRRTLKPGEARIYTTEGSEAPFVVELDDSFEDGYSGRRFSLPASTHPTTPVDCAGVATYDFAFEGSRIALTTRCVAPCVPADVGVIGIALEAAGGAIHPRISVVVPGSGAERAGITVGMYVLSVGGESTAGRTIADVIAAIRGPVGVPVRLGVADAAGVDAKVVEIVRQQAPAAAAP